jgi:hypothetical protein
MNRLNTVTAALTLIGVLGGCSVVPKNLEQLPSTQDAIAAVTSSTPIEWNETPVTVDGRAGIILIERFAIPDEILDKEIDLEFYEEASLREAVAILGHIGVSVLVSEAGLMDKRFTFPKYKGNLRGFIPALKRATGTFFSWQDGTILISEKQEILVSAPQETAFLKQMSEELTALGAKVVVSESAGFMRVEMTSAIEPTVRHFIERASKNSALITLQVAVLNVNLDKKRNIGVDWAGLQAVMGTGAKAMLSNNGETATTTDTETTATPSTTSTGGGTGMFPWNPSATELLKGSSLVLGGQGAGFLIAQKAFNLTGMVNFLSTYGNARTMQNASLKTVSGNEVTLESGMSIPYVADVGISSAGNSSGGALMGSTRTATAKSGITLKMNPRYDHDANLVTLKLDLSVDSVVAFNTLSAGNQIGSLTQPTTAKQGFNDILQLRPGETAIVGGVIYDSHGDSRSAPAMLDGVKLASSNGATTKNEMFIVIRPTVRIQGKVLP